MAGMATMSFLVILVTILTYFPWDFVAEQSRSRRNEPVRPVGRILEDFYFNSLQKKRGKY